MSLSLKGNGGSTVAKIIIELDTNEDRKLIELIERLIELLEKVGQADQ
tara:strand:+ start:112 stop:255 length:144 start_codon:yes stop_codon:yes gene_type:complete